MIEELKSKSCKPCERGDTPFNAGQIERYLSKLEGWYPGEARKSIWKDFSMKDFTAAVRFVNAIADLAESEGHHPDIHLTRFRKVRIELSTFAIEGISENDFIMATKIEALPKEIKAK